MEYPTELNKQAANPTVHRPADPARFTEEHQAELSRLIEKPWRAQAEANAERYCQVNPAGDGIGLILRHNSVMSTPASLYHRHRFPTEIISHCVWLYFRFALSFRDVEEMLAMRGVFLSYETVREWCLKFGQTYANGLRHKSSRPGDRWHLDEVFLKINGRLHYLWRAVDQDGDVLDILVQSRRDKKAAKKFFRKLLKKLRYVPRVIITDKLKSYGAAKAEVMPGVEHLQQKYQNNRAENSHQPTRLREKVMRRFKSAGHAQRFLSAFGIISSHFRVGRHLYSACGYRAVMKLQFASWDQAIDTGAPV